MPHSMPRYPSQQRETPDLIVSFLAKDCGWRAAPSAARGILIQYDARSNRRAGAGSSAAPLLASATADLRNRPGDDLGRAAAMVPPIASNTRPLRTMTRTGIVRDICNAWRVPSQT